MPSFVFLGANTPWVYALASALAADRHPVTAIAPYDAKNFYRRRPHWPEGVPPAALQRAFWVFPPGYAGTLAYLFSPLLRWRLARAVAAHNTDGLPWVIVPYPWFHRAVRDVPDARLIYYNLDDYSLYQPARKATILRQETALLERAALTICLSQAQVDTLRARCPARASSIRHFPLGVVEAFLNPRPESAPSPNTVGYVGNLTDRVDWRLVYDVAHSLPEIEFVFVGDLESPGDGKRLDWKSERAAALSLPNVRSAGFLAQGEVYNIFWSSAVNWIPYATDHAFNRASCPTKIMDALAAGRPLVSTDVPECRLYPEWIAVTHSTAEMTAELRRCMGSRPDPIRVQRQVEFARGNTWAVRAETFTGWLKSEDLSGDSLGTDALSSE